jgi:hypothetical protein
MGLCRFVLLDRYNHPDDLSAVQAIPLGEASWQIQRLYFARLEPLRIEGLANDGYWPDSVIHGNRCLYSASRP